MCIANLRIKCKLKRTEKKRGYNMMGGNRNKKKNSSWKLNHVLIQKIEQQVSEETIKGERVGIVKGKTANLILVSVSEILASIPTIKPEITTEEELRS